MTNKTPRRHCHCIDSVYTDTIDLSHKPERDQRTEGKKMNGIATPAALKIDKAVALVAAEIKHVGTEPNAFGGTDIWTSQQVGYRKDKQGRTYLAEGVRVATDDNEIIVVKFAHNGGALGRVTCTDFTSVELLAQIIKGLL